jgi:hypothetical protein
VHLFKKGASSLRRKVLTASSEEAEPKEGKSRIKKDQVHQRFPAHMVRKFPGQCFKQFSAPELCGGEDVEIASIRLISSSRERPSRSRLS